MNNTDKVLDLSNKNLTTWDDLEIVKTINQPEYNSIVLSNNEIVNMNLNILPDYYSKIDISENNILSITLKNIKKNTINLSQNKINEINIEDLDCEVLNLSNNNIKNITITNSKIGLLDLNTNLLETITFVNTSVIELDLSANRIKLFDSYPDGVEIISLFANKLCEIKMMPDTIKKIDLSNNKITNLDYISKNLNGIDISYNLIKDFDINILPPTVTYFDIGHNNIKDTSIFEKLQIEKCIYDKKLENDDVSDSDIEIEIKRKNITNIEISDSSSEEWDNDYSEEIGSALPDTESEDSSVSSNEEVDLLSFIRKMNEDKYNKKKDDSEKNEEKDDEITEILKKYKEQLSEEPKDLKLDNDTNSITIVMPEFERYHLQWNIVL
jgi:hypothetical protein